MDDDDDYSSGDDDYYYGYGHGYYDDDFLGCAEMFTAWLQDEYRKRKRSHWLASKTPEVQTAVKLKQNIESAVQSGSVARVKKYISSGAKVDTFHKDATLLHYAVQSGNVEVVTLLLANGAKPNYPARDGRSPLHWAVASGNIPIIKELLNGKANIHFAAQKDPKKKTVLLDAVASCNQEMIQVLLDYGADLHAVDGKGENALCYAVKNAVFKRTGYLQTIEYLISHGAKILKDGPKGDNLAFNCALKYGDLAVLKVFFDHGVKLENLRQEFVLHCAVENRQYSEVIKYLLDTDLFDVDQLDDCCCTPLHKAVSVATPTCIDLLLRYGANPNSLDMLEQTPLYLAVANSKLDSVRLLLEYDAEIYTDTCWGLLTLAEQKSGFSQSSRDTIGRLLIKRLALLESKGQIIETDDEDLIKKYPQEIQYFKACKDELEVLKNTYIYNTFTYYNVLTNGNVYTCVENKSVRDAFQRVQAVTSKFPIYGAQMHRRFSRLRQKHRIMKKAMEKLNHLLTFDLNAFPSIAYKILDYLRKSDLENLIRL
ncbi:hypothetical protein QAD02_019534 [Eretmocerus hayati]|uniref:Uncharacterized protein n=1 Tax=Eretmocerus hayati TaxID=131215 RepID=A0ACC2PN23_9HYME|nr:hypothetical protein QAD02_019534 [Eretmocerus hayati]